MQIVIWVIIGIVVVGGVALVVVIGARYARQAQNEEGDPVLERLAEATQRGENVSLEDIELQQPFMERVVVPFFKRVGEISLRFTPEKLLQETTLKLELAGNPGRLDAATFLSFRFVGAAVFGGLLLLISSLPTVNWPFVRVVLVVGIFTVLGFFFPQLWLQSRISRRQNEVRKAMPDALDLLTICVEAGLGFNELAILFVRAIR